MQISQLDEFFEIAYYKLHERSVVVKLVDDSIEVHAQYRFYNVSNHRAGPIVQLEMVVTQQQGDDLKAILADILQATNTAIETETGWTPYVRGETSGGGGNEPQGHTKSKKDRNC